MALLPEQLEFLANLPILINSSLYTSNVVEATTRHVKNFLNAEAATVFLLDNSGKQVSFWVLEGENAKSLLGKKMPANVGIVGWVIDNQKPTISNDPKSDSRFFTEVDNKSGFHTKSVMCIPLTLKNQTKLGALQVLNKRDNSGFNESDLSFLEHVGDQVSLAIGNANLLEESQNMANDLALLNRRKDDMLTILSHELGTPLNLMKSSVELLLDESLGDNVKKTAATLLNNGIDRLSQVSSNLRNAARLKPQDTFQTSIKPVIVNEILEIIEKEFSPVAKKRHLNLVVNKSDSELKVYADLTLVVLALHNLVANAIRFTPDNGHIIIKVEKGLGLCEFSVSDSGIGIEENQLNLIFEKFYEVGDVLSHSSGSYEFKSGGLGLGLSTAKNIINAHNSDIEVKSKPKQGSTFTFSLKLA